MTTGNARPRPPGRVRPVRIAPERRLAFGRKLRAWYARTARGLPWRRTRDPYRILISEPMLQQTQVARVVERYGDFLGRFPSLESIARARPQRVMKAWAAGQRRLWEIATAILPRTGAATWTHNQAVTELGALICTARVAHCDRCPVRRECLTAAGMTAGGRRSMVGGSRCAVLGFGCWV